MTRFPRSRCGAARVAVRTAIRRRPERALREAAARWMAPPLRRHHRSRAHRRVHRDQGVRRRRCRICSVCATRARDTVLYPAIAYPSYEMGAMLAGCRAVPVPLDADWHLDLDAISDADAERAQLVLWLNEPGNPASHRRRRLLRPRPRMGAARGIVVASDECYAEFAPSRPRSSERCSTACSPCTACRSVRTSQGCASVSTPAIPSSSPTSSRRGSTRD